MYNSICYTMYMLLYIIAKSPDDSFLSDTLYTGAKLGVTTGAMAPVVFLVWESRILVLKSRSMWTICPNTHFFNVLQVIFKISNKLKS